ncbi:hypothetical protein BH09ACT12_BH09ACT12_12980 [soil metagenome]
MTVRPHDVSDLYLAPVVLELDQRLGAFEGMSAKEIELRVALETDRQPRERSDRPQLVLQSLTHALETHGWEIGWAHRGLLVSHDAHRLVLGIPESLRAYLSD